MKESIDSVPDRENEFIKDISFPTTIYVLLPLVVYSLSKMKCCALNYNKIFGACEIDRIPTCLYF